MSLESPRSLPEHPNLRHLKDQAKAIVKAGRAPSLAEALLKIAQTYGFPSWTRLKAFVEEKSLDREVTELKQAIDSNDFNRVKRLILRNPLLHRAPLGYGEDGPLTWVAECRVPWEPPSPARLAIAEWMIAQGSDVHQGGNGPLMRAALNGYRIPMMELLVAHGADVNALWHAHFPIIFAPCESLDAAALKWLLDHGANPNCRDHGYEISSHGYPGTALDYLIAGYVRSSERLSACIDILLSAGGETKYNVPAVLALLRGQLNELTELINRDSTLVDRRFPELDCGMSGGRCLTLQGGTLLHVAAEFGNLAGTTLLLKHGADVNARATVDDDGVGGQTAIFHAATHSSDLGLPIVELLVNRGADLSVSVKIPGHYERPKEIVECTPLRYAELFPGSENGTTALLRKLSAPK